MSDPLFDMNFLGSTSSSPSLSHSVLLDPTLEAFPMPSGLDNFNSSRGSLFEHLGDTPIISSAASQSQFSGAQTSASQLTNSATQNLSNQSQGLSYTRSASVTDYSKHFSDDYSSAYSDTHPSQSTTTVTPAYDSISTAAEVTSTLADGTILSGDTQTVAQSSADVANAPVIDVVINNVVCSFSTRCHINLKRLARESMHVVYKPENGMVSMKIRKPYTTANIWSSGKITITGATSDESAKMAARRVSRRIQKLGFNVRLANYRVVNVLGTCSLPFGIRITHFSRDHPKDCSYEPELHPGATYKIKPLKATLKIFSTGSITVTAPKVENIQLAIQHIFPMVFPYHMADNDVTAAEAAATTTVLSAGNNKRVSKYDPKRQKARKKFRYYVEDSDGEVWSDSTDVELDSDEELECDEADM